MVMGAYARKHSRYHRSVECETDGALQILWNLWELHRFAKVLQICETGVMEKQETQRPNVLADVEEIYEYPKDTSTGVSKDISEKCLLGKWLIEEPYALIGHVRFCEGLLRLEPLIAKQYMMKGCEKSRQSLLDGGDCYGFACTFAAMAREIGYNPYVVLGRVSGTRDGAADGLTSHGWVIIDGCYYDPEAQFAGWYRGVYGSSSYDINHQIKSIVRFAS